MSNCKGCIRRAIYTALSDVLNARQSLASQSAKRPTACLHSARPSQSAYHSTITSIKKGHHVRLLRNGLEAIEKGAAKKRDSRAKGKNVDDPGLLTHRLESKVDQRNRKAREANKKVLDIVPQDGEGGKDAEFVGRKEIELEMKYLKDPLRLANTVLMELRRGDKDKVLELLRMADKQEVKSGVSWNHLVDYLLSKGNLKEALTRYNEMKKRGHRPDAHTYTIMLRGFANIIGTPGAKVEKSVSVVKQALSVYNSMEAPNSGAQPTVIHTNAILNVCGRANDMDSIWQIASKLPESGPGAPDKFTFTTILNALRSSATQDYTKLYGMDGDDTVSKRKLEQAVLDGRKLWEDVVARWRSGDLWIDDRVVSAMARLLLMSPSKYDWDEVFSLVQQTMRIPRQSPKIERWQPQEETASSGDPSVEETDEGPSVPIAQLDSQDEIDKAPSQSTVPYKDDGNADRAVSGSVFDAVDMPDMPSPKAGRARSASSNAFGSSDASVYPAPTKNTLSALLETAARLKSLSAGKHYWTLLTNRSSQYNLQPDADNIRWYLRLLRISRSSAAVVELLQSHWISQLDERFWTNGIFTLAMSTCMRDKNNPNVFKNATAILALMEQQLDAPSPRTLQLYLDLAILKTPGIRTIRDRDRVDSHCRDPRTEAWEEHEKEQREHDKAYDGETTADSPEEGPKAGFNPDPRQNALIQALRRLSPEVFKLQQLLDFTEEDKPDGVTDTLVIKRWRDEQRANQAQTETLIIQLISAYDRLLAPERRPSFEKWDGPPKSKSYGVSSDPADRATGKELLAGLRTQKGKLSSFLSRAELNKLPKERREIVLAKMEERRASVREHMGLQEVKRFGKGMPEGKARGLEMRRSTREPRWVRGRGESEMETPFESRGGKRAGRASPK